jgi:cleavage and polyadenylation specificity factor subunit 1
MKRVITRETLLAYPNFSEIFDIHTDASLYQLGACISQNGKPIAFYSRKLNPAQTRYTTTERELLSIVEVLKEFRNILLGQQIRVYTNHENLTQVKFNSDRVMRWRLYIEEYSPDLQYIKGENNVVADALSRLDMDDVPNLHEALITEEMCSEWYCYAKEEKNYDSHPLSFQQLDKAQKADKQLMKILEMDKTLYQSQSFHGGGITTQLICYKDKIVVPKLLQRHVIDWYHTVLCHPGINRTEETIAQHLWWPAMRDQITTFVQACPACQKNKRKQKKYGHLPPKVAEATIWDKMCIDLIGPYKIRRKGQPDLECKCVTMIDPASGWFEIHQYDDKRSITVANIAEQEWFSRYPWPTQITYDRGSEFIGNNFQHMIANDYGIKGKPITVRNPQANAIVERIHQVIANMIRTFELEENYLDEEDPWKGVLSATAFAVRSTYHTTLKKTPGQLVFGRDMIFNIQHVANWEYIRQNKQTLIDKNNKAENAKRVTHNYKVGDLVLLRKGTENKYKTPYQGPFDILKVYDNGTVRLRVGAVEDTYNIRRVTPYTKADALDHGGECSMPTLRRSGRHQASAQVLK